MNILYIIKENIVNEFDIDFGVNNIIPGEEKIEHVNEFDIDFGVNAANERSELEQTQKSAVLRKDKDSDKNNKQFRSEQIDAVLKKFSDTLQDIINSHVEEGNQIYIALLNYKKYNLTNRHSNPRNINTNKNINKNANNTASINNENNIDATCSIHIINRDIDRLSDNYILLLKIVKTSEAAKFITYDELVRLIFLSNKIICW